MSKVFDLNYDIINENHHYSVQPGFGNNTEYLNEYLCTFRQFSIYMYSYLILTERRK